MTWSRKDLSGFMKRIDTETSKKATEEGLARRKQVEAFNANTGDVGATDLAGFRAMLTKRYGNVVNGWMEMGAKHSKGATLGFLEFSKGCRNEGFQGDVRSMWKEVLPGENDGGVASLENFAPEAGKALKEFKAFLKEKHGD